MIADPPVAGIDGNAYQAALRSLVATCQPYLEQEDPDLDDMRLLVAHARSISHCIEKDGYRPRERYTRADVHRSELRRLCSAIFEFNELADYDDGALGLRVWEGFENRVRSAARYADQYGPNDDTWAPEDDTNPIKVVPIPEPDPTAEPVASGVRQGDWVQSNWDDKPRQILTGPNKEGRVRVSDPRDGAGNFGGYFIQTSMLGDSYRLVEQPAKAA